MTKISNTSFATASNPALERLGNVTGTALGKLVKSSQDLLEGLGLMAADRESQGMGALARASKTPTVILESTGKQPFATKELEEPDATPLQKVSAKGSFGTGFKAGFTAAKNAPDTAKPKRGAPTLAAT